MILINKVTPLANEAFQKDLIECILKNSGNSFINNIVVFYNNHNIVLPKNNKVNLVVKNGYTDREIIEYCKRIYNDDVLIFANPFVVFNNTLINLDKDFNRNAIKFDDCYIFDKNQFIDSSQENIERLFLSTTTNSKVVLEKKHNWIKEHIQERNQIAPIISKKNQKNIQKYLSKKEIKELPKIDVVIVSVDYNDILPITLSKIPDIFNVVVVTSPYDISCQDICKKLNVKCVISDRIYEDNAIFNKGKAINDGINSIDKPDWILLLDADIYLKDDFIDVLKSTNLTPQSLFITKRLIIDNYEMLLKWENEQDVGTIERAKGYGFFHLFNIKKFNKKIIFPENYNDASFSDLEFRDSFSQKKELDTFVIHLGPTHQNWTGRKTNRFTDNNYYYNVNEWGVVDRCNIEESKYGKLKIINSINFDYHNGGWLKSLKELKNINNINGLKFDCFLEKNFCWEGRKDEPYKDPWVGILHNPIDSPKWYLEKVKNVNIFDSKKFLESLDKCKGLYVFSKHEKLKVEDKIKSLNINLKVNCIKHTTSKSENKWSFSKYQKDKKILHIGWWFRDIDSFYDIKTNKKKVRIKINEKVENQIRQIFSLNNNDVNEISYLEDKDYEYLISSSIVYLKLIDAVANNTILECIERFVPVVVNRHPSIEEYLGKDYPLYLEDKLEFEELTSDDNILRAHKYLSNIKRELSLGRQIEKSSIYKDISSDFNIETLFEPNDIDLSRGGIYNPGFSIFKGKKYIISRVENLTEKERGTNDMWIKTTSVPHLSELDENLNIISTIKLKVIGNYKRIEDFRLFTHKNKLYSNHVLIDDEINIYPVISEINLEKNTLEIIGKVNIENQKKVEKNWTFFEKDNKLYLIYSVNPMIVYEVNIDDLSSTLIKNLTNELEWSIEGYLSSSTNPIKISENRYIMGIHSRDRNSIYHQGFLVFDDNFDIINCSKNPYLSGGDFDGIHQNVIYTSSLSMIGKNLVCFAGDGDTKTISIEIKNESIWKELL